MGYYPIVVTRNWDISISHSRDEHKKTGNKIIHEINDGYEVYYLPFEPTLKNRLFEKFYGTRFYFLYLYTSFVYNIGENFSSYFTPLLPLYRHCKWLLSTNPDINLMLISGSPFHLFKFGYKLKKKFGINWIADYRDDWNTNELVQHNAFKTFIQKVSKRNEIKWVGSADFFISVSDHYVKKICKLIGKTAGYTILNGYLNENYTGLQKNTTENFTIAYVGSLYPNQPVETFISAYLKFIDNFPQVKTRVIFVGLKAQPAAMENILKQVKGYESNFDFSLRVPKKEAINIQYNSSLLLIIAHKDVKGTPGSKLYEYVALQKPVLVCPSDGEIIEETLKKTGQGYFANTQEECYQLLHQLYKEYGYEFSEAKEINREAVKKYSRYENTKKLAGLMDKIQHQHRD